MKLLPTPAQIFLPLVVGCFVLASAPRCTQAQCPDATLVFSNVTSVEGKPFQAREITKIARYTGDGTPRRLEEIVMTEAGKSSARVGDPQMGWNNRRGGRAKNIEGATALRPLRPLSIVPLSF